MKLGKTKHDMPWAKHDSDVDLDVESNLRVTCAVCGERFHRHLKSVKERHDVVAMYMNNGVHPAGLVQDVFPDWTPQERELFLLSHHCDECWKKTMGTEEDERSNPSSTSSRSPRRSRDSSLS